jgi:hypothetical protein
MTERYALIEGPVWADTKFYGRWLLAASKANELWTEALNNRCFNKRVVSLLVTYIPDFNIAATVLLSRLEQNLASLVVDLHGEEEREEFAMMVGMGFFVLTGQRYQMVIPTRLTLRRVMNAALALAKTEDLEYMLHPEQFIVTMSHAEAKVWQTRLHKMDDVQRQADRWVLLDINPDQPSAVARV